MIVHNKKSIRSAFHLLVSSVIHDKRSLGPLDPPAGKEEFMAEIANSEDGNLAKSIYHAKRK